MQKVVLVIACLAAAGHGGPVKRHNYQAQSGHLNALASLLQSLNPSAASFYQSGQNLFNPSGPRPTVSNVRHAASPNTQVTMSEFMDNPDAWDDEAEGMVFTLPEGVTPEPLTIRRLAVTEIPIENPYRSFEEFSAGFTEDSHPALRIEGARKFKGRLNKRGDKPTAIEVGTIEYDEGDNRIKGYQSELFKGTLIVNLPDDGVQAFAITATMDGIADIR